MNLKAKAIENINAPNKPEIVLLTCNCCCVIGKGEFTGVIDIELEDK